MQSSYYSQRSKSPTPQTTTKQDSVQKKVPKNPDYIKTYKHMTNLNHALDFAGQFSELQNQLSVNDYLICPSFAVNYELCDNQEEDKIKKNHNFGYVNHTKLKDLAFHVIENSNIKSKNIKFNQLVTDERVNVKRPVSLSMPALGHKAFHDIKDIKMTQSHFTVKDLDPIDEVNNSMQESQTPQKNGVRTAAIQESNQESPEREREYQEVEKMGRPGPTQVIIIKDKSLSQRYWQKKFTEKPDIPIKTVSLRRTSHSPDSSMYHMSNGGNSQGLTVQTHRDVLHSKRHESDRGHGEHYYDRSMTSYNTSFNSPPIPYFQYSPNRLRSPGLERSQSPNTGSTLSASGFRELIGQEILNLSKTGRVPSKKDTTYLSAAKALEMSQSSKGKTSQNKEKKKLNYVIVDAGKRFSMPRSPKYEPKLDFNIEGASMQKSIKQLNNMIN